MKIHSRYGIAPLVVAAASLLLGCGTRGALGQGSFDYKCADQSDTSCDGFIVDPALPPLMARGSVATIEFKDNENNPFTVVSSAPALASEKDGLMVFHEPGTVALLATTGGTVVDFTHVKIALIDRIDVAPSVKFTGDPAGGTLEIAPMESRDLEVTPLSPGGKTLAGALTYEWTSLDPQVATVEGSFGQRTAKIVGVAPGSTTIQVKSSGTTGEIAILVKGGTP